MKVKSLLPADSYVVINKSLLNENDKLVLTMLYMPILGNVATTLYLTLYNELKASNFMTDELSHYHLMTAMNIGLKDIKEARIKLEGVGLLKTYYKEGSINSYVYELYSPMSAYEFFNHPIFNIVLYNYVGKEEYNRLVNYFKMPKINLKDYEDITTPFDMTFKSRSYKDYNFDNEDIVKKDTLKLNYELDYDFDLILSSIPKKLINERALNKTTKELIVNLAFLYDIDPITMSELIKISLNEKGLIEKDLLRTNARKYYTFNNDNKLPSLIFKHQPDYLRSPKGDNSNKGRMIKVFENNSPYEFLRSKNKGAKPTERDMKILESLIVDLKLNPAVVNVLIDYVLKTNNNKLTKAYIDTIASQWKRLNIETAKEAMEIAEKEHNKYKKNKTTKETKKETETPVWFDKNISSTPVSDEEKEELENMLKSFR